MTDVSSPPASTSITGYLPELDGVRAASVLLVLAAHMLPLGPKVLQLNAASGLMGMSLFFCLSGFLITRFLHARPNIRVFLVRRMARIVPLAVLYGAVVALLLAGRWDSFAAISFYYLNYAHSAFVPASGHLWSLCVEMHFYLAMAFAVALFGRRGFWLIPLAAVIVLALRIEVGVFSNIKTHLRVDEILAGCMLALVWLHPDYPASRTFIRAVRTGFWVWIALWFLSSHELGGALNYLRPWFTMAVVGGLLFQDDGWLRRLCRTAVLKYIATVSYALYVWHPMTMLGWLGEGGGWERYLTKRPISFALTFALAHASTFYFEKFFTNLARKRTA